MNKKAKLDVELTNSEKEWFHTPKVRSEFRSNLLNQLSAFQKTYPSNEVNKQANKIWNVLSWPIVERLLPSGLTGGIISIVVALVMISGVVYAVSIYAGYIPGLGIINQDAPVRVLSSVQTQLRDGIQLKIVSALSGADNTAVVYSLKGVPPGLFAGNDPLTPNNQRCDGGVRLELPDGQELGPLGYGSLGYGKENDYQKIAFFPTIPENMKRITFAMDCIEGTYPEQAPENWSVPIILEESSGDLITFPIQKVETNNEVDPKNSIVISELIPVEDNFIVLGRYIPEHKGIYDISLMDVSFLDAGGNHLPYRIPGDIQFFNNDEVGRFAYILEAYSASFPIKLQVDRISYYCWGDTPFKIDLDTLPPDNKIHSVEEYLTIGNCTIKLVSMRNSGTNLILGFEADNHTVNYVSIQDINNPTGKVMNKSFGESATAQLSLTNSMDKRTIELWIGGVGLEPLGPWSAMIE